MEKTKYKHRLQARKTSLKMRVRSMRKRHTTAFSNEELGPLAEEVEKESVRPRCQSAVVKGSNRESHEKSQQEEETFV